MNEKIVAVFQKYGAVVEQNILSRYPFELRIREQPNGLSSGFDGLVHIVESHNKNGKQIFCISTVATWLGLSRATEYKKQLNIALSILEDLQKIDPEIVEDKIQINVKDSTEK